MARGIVAHVAIRLARPLELEDVVEIHRERYAGRPFVRVLEGGPL
jgi:N-acetyl-gamma-glutamylphosphate reductase